MERSTAYEVFGLAQGAGEDEIKATYRKLAQKYNVEQYGTGPLRDTAEAKMREINEAFDTLMSFLRTGASTPRAGGDAPKASGASASGRFPAIRRLINAGQVDQALAELSAVPHGDTLAEWNFLMGSAYYYKGWLDRALRYFQAAVRIEPGNREYEAALRNLQQGQNGSMQGNPYGSGGSEAAAMNCACNTCTLMCCMDACCGMGRGCC